MVVLVVVVVMLVEVVVRARWANEVTAVPKTKNKANRIDRFLIPIK